MEHEILLTDNRFAVLMQALETHSTAFFVTCDSAAEDCMNERFLSRFHVALNLPELTKATRETIWQKCLESHEDISFFVDRKTLAGWPLNGREIKNAVTAAKTLAIDGTLDMKQLERVIPASKRPIMRVPIVEDPWDSPPVSKDKKKMKVKKPVVDEAVEIVEEPAKRDDDDWGNWGTWGIKKKTKKDPIESEFPDGFGIRQAQVTDKDVDTLAIRKCRTSDWVGFDAPKRLISSPPFSPPPNWGKTSTWASGALENGAGWDFSKPKKSEKGKDAAAKKPRILEAADARPVPAFLSKNYNLAEIDDSWGDWRSKKDKNAQQATSPSPEVTMPAEGVAKKDELPLPDIDDGWGSIGRKKETKAKKISNTEPEAPPSAETATASQPLLPPVEVDEWDFWASSKKSKKGKKKAVIDEPLSLPPAAESIQGQDNGIKRSLHSEQICDIRGIKQYILDGAHDQTCGTSSIERGGATTLTPGSKIFSKAVAQPNQCRFCGGRSDAKKGQYCKHCGAHVL